MVPVRPFENQKHYHRSTAGSKGLIRLMEISSRFNKLKARKYFFFFKQLFSVRAELESVGSKLIEMRVRDA